MSQNKQNHKLGLSIIALALALSYWSIQKWLITAPQPLPQRPTSAIKNSFNDGFYNEISILASQKNNYLRADYRIWIPDGVKKIRGLIVKQHGCGDGNSPGLNHANDSQWQALASKHQFALVGTRLPQEYPMCTNKALVDRAAEDTFLKAISMLAQKTHHQELNTVPWIMWGHSGGADWGTQMLEHYPEKTIAIINVHSGGIRSTSGNSEIFNLDSNSKLAANLLKTPVLWFVGAKDHCVEECVDLPKAIFDKFNQENALWALAIGPNTAHETGDTRLLAIPYLDAIARARLNDKGELHPLNPARGWIGNVVNKKVVLAEQYQGNSSEAVWLPDEETALKWQQYVTSNKIYPLNKPNAPTNVTVTEISSTTKLIKWNFTPDLENGLPDFRIYRNGSLIKTLAGQSHDYGDVTDSPYPILEFQDSTASPNSTYTVAAFNHLGESVSAPASTSD